jgi:hypothetical protein
MSSYESASIYLQIAIGVVAICTLAVYYHQLRVMSRQLSAMQESSKAQSSLSLVEFLQAPDVRHARHIVRSVLSKKPIGEWSEEERNSASVVTANYDVAGALIKGGLAPVELVAANWGPSIIHCYEVLAPYIEEHRNRPGAHPRYWSNFQWLAERAEECC